MEKELIKLDYTKHLQEIKNSKALKRIEEEMKNWSSLEVDIFNSMKIGNEKNSNK